MNSNEITSKLHEDIVVFMRSQRKSDTRSLAESIKTIRELQSRAAQLGETPGLLAGANRHLRMAYQMSKVNKQDKVADSVMEAAVMIRDAADALLSWRDEHIS